MTNSVGAANAMRDGANLNGLNYDFPGDKVQINLIRSVINILAQRGFNGGNCCCWPLVLFASVSQMKFNQLDSKMDFGGTHF